ncbi:four helix bundle protein [Mongoliibacter ruber]|uniref:Four helix bundle protein n=1 Tax=Mongoliibacter ruber TaxID=1750599 RepID=A0A2T0WAZ0_9BACT|nr:four helix bundle protein [Mongoliibacter ruber]PRY83796.1 four helix bundle protein [Mongoliibacter ruber]
MQNLLKQRTKRFALDIIELVEFLPKVLSAKIISYQLVKSATSVGANYRAVCRARSDNEFISKMQIVLEEVDESGYWLELIQEKAWADVTKLLQEANELTAIFVSSLKTIKNKSNPKPTNKPQI